MSETLAANEYRCEACRGVFQFAWSNEEAEAEAARDFPDLKHEDRAIVCDDCYRKIMGKDASKQ